METNEHFFFQNVKIRWILMLNLVKKNDDLILNFPYENHLG